MIYDINAEFYSWDAHVVMFAMGYLDPHTYRISLYVGSSYKFQVQTNNNQI